MRFGLQLTCPPKAKQIKSLKNSGESQAALYSNEERIEGKQSQHENLKKWLLKKAKQTVHCFTKKEKKKCQAKQCAEVISLRLVLIKIYFTRQIP